MPVNIQGKEYVTVAERITALHFENKEGITINTEVLNDSPVVIKATVTLKRGTFTGISAANPNKMIEKQSPYEVAETSAIGRALGFAGYGVTDSIASADEMVKATGTSESWLDSESKVYKQMTSNVALGKCPKCQAPMVISKTSGKQYCSAKCWLK
jgi:hypothetical protein